MNTSTAATLTSMLALTSIAGAATPTFEDQTLGDTHLVGDVFSSDGVNIRIEPIVWLSGTTFSGGSAHITADGWAGGSGLELNTNNCTAMLDFAGSVGPQAAVQLLFGEYGGNVNLNVNGDFRNVHNPIDLHGMVVGGCLVEVIAGGFGNDHGRMVISGAVHRVAIGGQEFALDMTYQSDCNIAFEDLTAGDTYLPGDVILSDGHELGVEAFQWSNGTWNSGGRVDVWTMNEACGNGLELYTNNSSTRLKFTPNPVQNLQWQFGEYGGNINFAINGDFRNVQNYMDLNGLTVGGCVVHVLAGGLGNDCGEVQIEGDVHELLIGGQEHTIDCLIWDEAPATPGDIDGDGDVDIEDLLALIAAWGSNDPAADINGDGTVNVDDLMALLANYQN
ncbi:MAG: dockerin type I domain-containing protein [Phycisphaerales bacterium]|nr:dockerin type I domain-containing protein [Phycisphaerales bacterium]